MHFVKKINYIDGYKISLTFDDKKTKVIDIEPYLDKGIFLTLRDPDYFNLVKVKYDTIVWPNEADFCPDVLYEIGKEPKHKPMRAPRRIKKQNKGFNCPIGVF
jgi:hypothetical protein